MNQLQRILYGTLDLLLPVRCITCGAIVPTGPDKYPFCGPGVHPLPVMTGSVCRQCSRPLHAEDPLDEARTSTVSPPPERSELCGSCRRTENYLEFVLAGFRYEQPLRDIVSDWKFGGHPEWTDWLGRRLLDQLPDQLPVAGWDGLVPVPLHPDRLEERGFNQAERLAETLSVGLGSEVHPIVEKHQRTRPQSELGRQDRIENLAGCFRIRGTPRQVSNRSFLIVDDVYTTGSTLRTLGDLLLKAGAQRVGGLVLARST